MHWEYCCIARQVIDFILRKATYSKDLVMIHVSYKVTSESESQFQIP